MEQSNLNTLIVPVYWETLESEEGKFDFTLVDALIKQADKYKNEIDPALVRSLEERRVRLRAGMDEEKQ